MTHPSKDMDVTPETRPSYNKSLKDVAQIKYMLEQGLLEDADEQAIADILASMEGMAEDAVVALLYSIEDDQAMVHAIDESIEVFSARKTAAQLRAKSKRMLIAQFLRLINEKTIKTPAGTVSVAESPMKLEIVDEALVPARFVKIEEREPVTKIDAAAILKAIKGGESIDGVRAYVEDTIIKIRRK